jgi:predicted nicotinamide N-methyase
VPVSGTVQDRRDFVRRYTELRAPGGLPELRLYLADEVTRIWELTEEEMRRVGLDPPFWSFAWAGGQAVSRYLLDHPEEVRSRRVLDVACGSGICGIAARLAGAASVLATDIDPFCRAAVALNAEANGVEVEFTDEDQLLSPPPAVEVVLAGDVCYDQRMTERMLPWLRAAAAGGARVLLGDPGRAYFPSSGITQLAEYEIPTSPELEEVAFKRSGVYRLAP